MNQLPLIGLSGKAGCGKDFCADLIIEITNTYQKRWGKWAFADPLKANVFANNEGRFSIHDVFDLKPPHIRTALQQEGTENGRDKRGRDVWLFTAQAMIYIIQQKLPVDGLVFPDARFLNEIEFIQNGGITIDGAVATLMQVYGDIWSEDLIRQSVRENIAFVRAMGCGNICLRIKSDRGGLQGEQGSHRSETEMDRIPDSQFDGIIINNQDTTREALITQLAPYVQRILAGRPM